MTAELTKRNNLRLSSFGVDVPEPEEDVNYEEEWQGMPEFNQEDLGAVKSIKVNFATVEDMQAFSVLLKQTITDRTRSLWYPKKEHMSLSEYVYHDES